MGKSLEFSSSSSFFFLHGEVYVLKRGGREEVAFLLGFGCRCCVCRFLLLRLSKMHGVF